MQDFYHQQYELAMALYPFKGLFKGLPALYRRHPKWLRDPSIVPTPPNVPLLKALWSLVDGFWGSLKGSGGVLVL